MFHHSQPLNPELYYLTLMTFIGNLVEAETSVYMRITVIYINYIINQLICYMHLFYHKHDKNRLKHAFSQFYKKKHLIMREYEIESSLQYFTLFSFRIFMLCAKFSFLYAVYEKRRICHNQSLEKSKYTCNVV